MWIGIYFSPPHCILVETMGWIRLLYLYVALPSVIIFVMVVLLIMLYAFITEGRGEK